MTKLRHDLMLQIVKLMDAALVTVPFALCWYLYYAQRVAAPLYKLGDYLIVALFFILYITFGRVYDAFQMSMQRISELVYQRLHHVHCHLAFVQTPSQSASGDCGPGGADSDGSPVGIFGP